MISGQSKGTAYCPGCFDPKHMSEGPGDHAWVAFRLHDEWFLCDPTWAAGMRGRWKHDVTRLNAYIQHIYMYIHK